MHVVHIVRQYFPGSGGIESVVQDLASVQCAGGHSVRVVTLDRLFNSERRGKLAKREFIGGIEIVRIPFIGSHRYPIAPSVLKYIRDADVVHVHAIDFFFDFLAWTKLFHRKRLVVSTHGGFFHTSFLAWFKQVYFNIVTRASLTWYDGIATVSEADHTLFSLLRHSGTVCIENGVNVGKFRGAGAPEPRKVIAWVGRFSSNKRLDRLLAFLASLRKLDGDWKLKIAGRPWDIGSDELISAAKKAGIAEAVELYLAPAESELRKVLNGCSIIASASEYEGFGLVAVEGLSAGLYPILSDIPPYHRLLSRTGIGTIVDFADPDKAATEFLIKWRELSRGYLDVRKGAIEAASAFDWCHVAKQYMELYEAARGISVRVILDVPVRVWSRVKAVSALDQQVDSGIYKYVVFANANSLNRAYVQSEMRAALQQAIVINDGAGVDIASKVLFGAAFPQNLNGTDFTPHYLTNTKHRFRIFLLGGRPGVAQRAGAALMQLGGGHSVVGYHDGYFSRADDARVAQMVRKTNADLVLVAMGNPDQELWLQRNFALTGCRLGFAVGALFDYLAGDAQRAPAIIRTARLEWAYRLFREPGRLWRRYIIGNPLFLLRVFEQWVSGARV